jgi:hypothetical protein
MSNDTVIENDDNGGSLASGEFVDIEDDDFIVDDEDVVDDEEYEVVDSEHLTIAQTDPTTGEVVEHTIDLAMPPLNESEAKEITERIRTTTNVLYLLIKRAHAGRAWAALGYGTFEEYVNEEFKMSRSYAYRLLSQANVIEAIEAKAPEGTKIHIGEGISRDLKKVLPDVLSEVEERTTGLDQDQAGAVIEDIIREQREKQAAAEVEEAEKQYEGPYTGDYDAYTDDEDEEQEESSGTNTLLDDPADARRKFEKLYSLYSALKNIADLGDGDELIDFIPENRHEEFTTLLAADIPWLTEFKTKWDAYLNTLPEADELDEDDEFLDDDDE